MFGHPVRFTVAPASGGHRVSVSQAPYGRKLSVRTAVIAFVTASTLATVGAVRAPAREIENVAAFARLYGVVRYFYPSDAAAKLDWNRFAIYGVQRTRTAPRLSDLKAALTELFEPLGSKIVLGAAPQSAIRAGNTDPSLIAWRYPGPPNVFWAVRTNRPSIRGEVRVTQTLPATPLRGKAIRFRSMARVHAEDALAEAAALLEIKRSSNNQTHSDQPILDDEWRERAIETTVASDATDITVGVRISGAVTVDVDALSLEFRESTGAWTPFALEDAAFEAPDSEQSVWRRDDGFQQPITLVRMDGGAPEGRHYLRVGPATNGPDLPQWTIPKSGDVVDVTLAAGLTAQVALALEEAEAREHESLRGGLSSLRARLGAVAGPSERPDVDARLADVVVAWNVYRHFYPYWSDTGVDWDRQLMPQLTSAYSAESRQAEADSLLRTTVVAARDGHGQVVDALHRDLPVIAPLRLGAASDRFVITASSAPAAPVGAVVTSIDGMPPHRRKAEVMRLLSGSDQYRAIGALFRMTVCSKPTMELRLETTQGPRTVTLSCQRWSPTLLSPERRPAAITEVEPGIWYVDVTRPVAAEIRPKLEALAHAPAVIFDLRGYPNDFGVELLSYLIDAPETDRWMHRARITGPFGRSEGWEDGGWNLKPRTPYFSGKRVFLTDGRAISAAESVMLYVADRKLATIIGAPTAGTGGNTATFETPGGFSLTYTVMRVTRHDGHTPFHLIGVQPDIRVEPTLVGIRAGRDEVLERAIEFVQGK